MCVIVDANSASLVFGSPVSADMKPLVNWLFGEGSDGCLVYGGKLAAELQRLGVARRSLVVLLERARAHLVNDATTDAEESVVASLPQVRSNDPHVLALARLSGARVLCTKDDDLTDDFRDTSIVPTPKGKVYRRAEHAHLLKHCKGCPRYGRKKTR